MTLNPKILPSSQFFEGIFLKELVSFLIERTGKRLVMV
jgi:hypothetical protein